MQPLRLRPELPDLQAAIRVLLAGVALLALFSVPIFSTVLPPLFDYPNHLARFWLLLTGGNAFYEVRWAPLPNLAGDLIVPLLARDFVQHWDVPVADGTFGGQKDHDHSLATRRFAQPV